MKITQKQFKMFQRTCKRFHIPKDSIHLNLKKFMKSSRYLFKKRFTLTTLLLRRKRKSILVRWVKRSGFFAPKQKQSAKWKRMRMGRRKWSDMLQNKFNSSEKRKKKIKNKKNAEIVRSKLKKQLQLLQMGRKKNETTPPKCPPKVVVAEKSLGKKKDDDWWGDDTRSKTVRPVETLCISSDEEVEAAAAPIQTDFEEEILALAENLAKEERRVIAEHAANAEKRAIEECLALSEQISNAEKLADEDRKAMAAAAAAAFAAAAVKSTNQPQPKIATPPKIVQVPLEALAEKSGPQITPVPRVQLLKSSALRTTTPPFPHRVVRVVKQPMSAEPYVDMPTSSEFQLVKPLISTKPRSSFNFIDSLINKLRNNGVVEAEIPSPARKEPPMAHCSKTSEPIPDDQSFLTEQDSTSRDSLPTDVFVLSKEELKKNVMTDEKQEEPTIEVPKTAIPPLYQKKKVGRPKGSVSFAKREQPNTVSKQNTLALFDDNTVNTTVSPNSDHSSDNEFLGFETSELVSNTSKNTSPEKYKNINHSAFLGSDTNFDDVNLDDTNLLEPMRDAQDGMVHSGTRAPIKLQLPKRPDNMKKPRTVAEKKILLKNKKDIRYLMIENESKIFHELTKRNRMNVQKPIAQEPGSTSWARSVEGKNYELMNHLQNQTVPFTRDSWRALAFLKTEDRKYYFQNVTIDLTCVKLAGSCGNHESQVLADKKTSWPNLRYQVLSRKDGKCCNKPIELPKNLWIQLVVNDEIISFAYDVSKKRPQVVKTYKLPESQLGLHSGFISKCLLDPSKYTKAGPLSSKLHNPHMAIMSEDEDKPEIFKMPTVQLEVFPKLYVALDTKVYPYLKMLLPFECITPEWANFAVSAVTTRTVKRDRRLKPVPVKNEIVSYTFDIPYENEQTQILVRKPLTKSRVRVHRPALWLDEKFDLDEPLQFAANINKNDEVEVEIANMLTEMTNCVAISCNDAAFIYNDPDLVYDKKESERKAPKVEVSNAGGNVGRPKTEGPEATKSAISRRVIKELTKLNATFITASNDNDVDVNKEICTQEFCIKGCICESLNQYIPAIRNKHCDKAGCMFECLCGFTEELNSISSLTNADVRSLRDKATARLAPVEKEFTPTIVLTNNRTILIAGKEHESRRSKKTPKRYDDFLVSKEDEQAANSRHGKSYRATFAKHSTKPGAVSGDCVEVGTSRPQNTYSSKVEHMLHVNVVLNRLTELKDLEPFCMVHSLFKCYCKGEKTTGTTFSFHDPQSIAEAVRTSAQNQKTPDKQTTADKKILQHTKRAAEIDHGLYNANPMKRSRMFGGSMHQTDKIFNAAHNPLVLEEASIQEPQPPVEMVSTEDTEELLDSLVNDAELSQRAQRCLPVNRFYVTRNYFQKDTVHNKLIDTEKKYPERLTLLRERMEKCFEDYKDEIHRQRLGFPKLEIECSIADTGDKNDPIYIFIKDSQEKILTNPILKKLADGKKMLIFTGSKKYYIDAEYYEKNKLYLISTLREQTSDTIYVIQRDPAAVASDQPVKEPETVEQIEAKQRQMTAVQRLNAMTTATMQNICDIQRENTKNLMEPKNGQIYIFGWQHLLKGFEQHRFFVWEMTFVDDTRAVLITMKGHRPRLVNTASVVNLRALTLMTHDISLVSRMLIMRLENVHTKNLAVLLKGTLTFWIICGFLKSSENYVEHGLKVRPTPESHPKLSKKISAFYEEMFGPPKQKPKFVDTPSTTFSLEPQMPIISNVSSLNPGFGVVAPKPLIVGPATNNETSVESVETPIQQQPPTPPAQELQGDLENTLPVTSISKTAPKCSPELLNSASSNIKLVQENIHNTLALPIQTFPHRWFMLSVVNDFSDIYIPQWQSYLAYDKIVRAIIMAQRVHKTVQLQSNCAFPQVYAVPETTNRVFLGPYTTSDSANLKLCQNIDNEIMLREVYEKKFGVQRKTVTTGCWLYLKSVTAKLPFLKAQSQSYTHQPNSIKQNATPTPMCIMKRKSNEPILVESAAKKVMLLPKNSSLLKHPVQIRPTLTTNAPTTINTTPSTASTAKPNQNFVQLTLPKVITSSGTSELRSILINTNSRPSQTSSVTVSSGGSSIVSTSSSFVSTAQNVSTTRAIGSSITSSCIINSIPNLQTMLTNERIKTAKPVGHLANQPIFPKFDIQFTAGGKNPNIQSTSASQRMQIGDRNSLGKATPPPVAVQGEPVYINSQPLQQKLIPARRNTIDSRVVSGRSSMTPPTTPIDNIDLTRDDLRTSVLQKNQLASKPLDAPQKRPANVEIDLTSDDEIPRPVLVKPKPVEPRRAPTPDSTVASVAKLMTTTKPVHQHIISATADSNCQVCSTISISKYPSTIGSTTISAQVSSVPTTSLSTADKLVREIKERLNYVPRPVISAVKVPVKSVEELNKVLSGKPPEVVISNPLKPPQGRPPSLKKSLNSLTEVTPMLTNAGWMAVTQSSMVTPKVSVAAPPRKLLPTVAKKLTVPQIAVTKQITVTTNSELTKFVTTTVAPPNFKTMNQLSAVRAQQIKNTSAAPAPIVVKPAPPAAVNKPKLDIVYTSTVVSTPDVELILPDTTPEIPKPLPSVPAAKSLQLATTTLTTANSMVTPSPKLVAAPSNAAKSYQIAATIQKVIVTEHQSCQPTPSTSTAGSTSKSLPPTPIARPETQKSQKLPNTVPNAANKSKSFILRAPSKQQPEQDKNLTGVSNTLKNLPTEAFKDPNESERVQFGYFVCSFIFLGRLKAKETGDKYSIKFPTLGKGKLTETYEWKLCGTLPQAGDIINSYLRDLIHATIPYNMPIIWKFITNRNVFNSYRDHTASNLNKNTVISKHGIHNWLNNEFEEYETRDNLFYHEVLTVRLASIVMQPSASGAIKLNDILDKATRYIAQLNLEEKKLIQLKKISFEKNRQLSLMIASKKEAKKVVPPKEPPTPAATNADVVVLVDDNAVYDDEELSIVSITDPSNETKRHQVVTIKKRTITSTAPCIDKTDSIIQKIRNTNIIRKLPKDLTISKTAAPEALQVERKATLAEKMNNLKHVTTKRKVVGGGQQEDGEPAAKLMVTQRVGETLITRKNNSDSGAAPPGGDTRFIQLDSDSEDSGDFEFMSDVESDDFLDDKKATE